MSADNGVYILKTLDNQYRVIDTQNIENLWWSYLKNGFDDNPVPTRIIEYYYGVPSMNHDEANIEAEKRYEELAFCEYGIQTIKINKTWKEIISEAKSLAKEEIEAIENSYDYKKDKEFYDEFALRLLKNLLKKY